MKVFVKKNWNELCDYFIESKYPEFRNQRNKLIKYDNIVARLKLLVKLLDLLFAFLFFDKLFNVVSIFNSSVELQKILK